MSEGIVPREAALERIERWLHSYTARVALSFLIIISVLPLTEMVKGTSAQAWLPEQGLIELGFLVIFGVEFMLRLTVYRYRLRQGRASIFEPILLVLDLMAVLSFLPLQELFDVRYARMLRLTRIVLLLGYWADMVRSLWTIVTSRERRFQIFFVLLSGVIIAFAGAVVQYWVQRPVLNPASGPATFGDTLWWAFRQVQDPGNLVSSPRPVSMLLVSLFLTLAGLLLFSFLIGIGTTAIEELMIRSRTLPVGMRNHTVILGVGEHSHFLLSEFAEIYRKNRRALRSAVLGPSTEPPNEVVTGLDVFRYRQGDPVRGDDLDRVDVRSSKRVLILGTDPYDPDAGVVATILATRDRNPGVALFPDLEHESSLDAARTAGGANTHVIGSGSFIGNYIAQNIANPGIYRLYRQLLTSAGCEIYTYVFEEADQRKLGALAQEDGSLDAVALHEAASAANITLIGCFVAPPDHRAVQTEQLEVLLAPTSSGGPSFARTADGQVKAEAVRGLIGISNTWEDLRGFALRLVAEGLTRSEFEVAPGYTPPSLRRAGLPVQRMLVLGSSRRIPRVVADVVAFYGSVEVTVLVRDIHHLRNLSRDFSSAIRRTLPKAELTRGEEEHELHFSIRGTSEREHSEWSATVRFEETDWGDAARLVHHPNINLDRTDVLLLLPRTRGADAIDGQIALDCLQLARLQQRGEGLHPGARVLAMVQDPVKGDLLESRLDAMTQGTASERFTIVASERLRHHFIVQNVFVRGLNAVYLRLFAPSGPSIWRVEAVGPSGRRPDGKVDVRHLRRHLLEQRGLVLLGFELSQEPDEPVTIMDPEILAQMGSGSSPSAEGPTDLSWSSVRAFYVVGELD